jgi:hypothetical protein
VNIANSGLESLRGTAFGTPAAILGCATLEGVNIGLAETLSALQTVCAVATCSPDPGLGWYARYQSTILNMYNALTLKGPVGLAKTTSLYDNLILSAAGLCAPGVVYNLDKMRQVQCRYIYCLENEVPAGIATVEACRELKDYQECKYVWGEVFQFIPFVPAVNQILSMFKSMLTDPVGLIRGAIVYGCALGCPTSNTWVVVCDIGAWVVTAVDLMNDIISGYTHAKTIKEDYCSQVL